MAMTRPLAAAFLAVALLGGAPGRAQSGDTPFTVVEGGESFGSLQDAVNAIGEGRGTIRIASGRYTDCAVQEAGTITFAAAVPGEAVFDGGMCEEKATLVLRGHAARVEGL